MILKAFNYKKKDTWRALLTLFSDMAKGEENYGIFYINKLYSFLGQNSSIQINF